MSKQPPRSNDNKTTSNKAMDRWEGYSAQHDAGGVIAPLAFDSYANSTASTSSLSPWSEALTVSNAIPWAPQPSSDIDFDPFASYDTSLPFSPSDISEDSRTNLYSRTGTPSPVGTYEPGPFLDPISCNPRSSSMPAAPTPGFMTAQSLISDPRLRGVIQTSSEYRRTRRRAQNRSAQHAFKQRQKKREKELVEQVDVAERSYKDLEAQNRQLKDELERKKGGEEVFAAWIFGVLEHRLRYL